MPVAGYLDGHCPRGSMRADGAELKVHDYQALYAIIRNEYGGDMRAMKFNLPDLRDAELQPKVGRKIVWCIVVQGNFPERHD